MNVRLVMHRTPTRTDLYGGIDRPLRSDGVTLILPHGTSSVRVKLSSVKEIILDDEPGDWW